LPDPIFNSTLVTKFINGMMWEGKKSVAVFYGAGHLPDMEKRLAADFGLKREGEKWLTAWSLEKKK